MRIDKKSGESPTPPRGYRPPIPGGVHSSPRLYAASGAAHHGSGHGSWAGTSCSEIRNTAISGTRRCCSQHTRSTALCGVSAQPRVLLSLNPARPAANLGAPPGPSAAVAASRRSTHSSSLFAKYF